MKRSAFKIKPQLTEAQRQVRDAYRGYKRANKYGAIPTNGYHSKWECEVAEERKLMVKADLISHYEEQKEFVLTIYNEEGEKKQLGVYIADFWYFDKISKVWVIEDAKGKETDVFRLKWAIAQLLYRFHEGDRIVFKITKKYKRIPGYKGRFETGWRDR